MRRVNASRVHLPCATSLWWWSRACAALRATTRSRLDSRAHTERRARSWEVWRDSGIAAIGAGAVSPPSRAGLTPFAAADALPLSCSRSTCPRPHFAFAWAASAHAPMPAFPARATSKRGDSAYRSENAINPARRQPRAASQVRAPTMGTSDCFLGGGTPRGVRGSADCSSSSQGGRPRSSRNPSK
jgi:hypothetical protein